MCGIAGGFYKIRTNQQKKSFTKNLAQLFYLSSIRGQDAAGLALYGENKCTVIKDQTSPQKFIKSLNYKNQVKDFFLTPLGGTSFLLHCRLMTSGQPLNEQNNQPQIWKNFAGVHNGIITEISGKKIDLNIKSEFSDSYKLFEELQNLIRCELIGYSEHTLESTLDSTIENLYQSLKGEANLALYFPKNKKFILATNTGSIYYIIDRKNRQFFFMSEKFLLESFLKNASGIPKETRQSTIHQLKSNQMCTLSIAEFELNHKTLDSKEYYQPPDTLILKDLDIQTRTIVTNKKLPHLKRCSSCILPETYPFISFDEKGICNFCHRYQKQIYHGKEELLKFLEPFRSKNSSPDCLVGLSGGRDSSYGLHLLKNELGMSPIAYTFDWGLTTDVSRRNQSIMCGKLGIEHIIRSANLSEKRMNIQKNVHAFFRKPHMGMVPLFMSGDKEFYNYGRTLRKETGTKLTVFCAGHSLEQRDFFTGFCGVNENIENNKRLFHFTLQNKIRLAFYYSSQYALNPSYINQSFFDSILSFFYSFVYRDDFLYLYEYWPWNESEIEKTLSHYGWESDKAYGSNQWRMGDGQTAFTNYIYLAVAGFSEFDNYRSNQIREGMITREDALKAVDEDNQTKQESLQYFADVVGINLVEVLKKIDQIPKLY
jgi:glucosamine--fructose-6-phosphate aminotransferase (isomerizing)